MTRYYKECPTCGSTDHLERPPTLEELLADTVREAISQAIGDKWQHIPGWPGYVYIARLIAQNLDAAGLKLVWETSGDAP